MSRSKIKELPYTSYIRQVLLLSTFIIPIVILLDLAFFPKTLEDAFITVRYSKRLAEGFGIVAWNITGGKIGLCSCVVPTTIVFRKKINLMYTGKGYGSVSILKNI